MTCEQLSVFQIRGVPLQATLELVAQGNVTVEGDQFRAEAHRLSYDQQKDLFVLEGSGRGDVHLVRQAPTGGSRQETSADKIRYSPGANTVQVNGMKMLDLGTFPSPQR
jgi:lipopolysaccharide export system protein LptA